MTRIIPPRKPRPAPPGALAKSDIAGMIRVDHAGELGAVRIYQGQLAVLAARKSKAVGQIEHMAAQEREHLAGFNTLIQKRAVRPTALEPVWRIAGYMLGAASAMMGEKGAMACTAAVEEVIDVHYAGQAARLDAVDPELKAMIENFRADEIAHRDTALAAGAENAFAFKLFSGAIKAGCRLAIALSTRI